MHAKRGDTPSAMLRSCLRMVPMCMGAFPFCSSSTCRFCPFSSALARHIMNKLSACTRPTVETCSAQVSAERWITIPLHRADLLWRGLCPQWPDAGAGAPTTCLVHSPAPTFLPVTLSDVNPYLVQSCLTVRWQCIYGFFLVRA